MASPPPSTAQVVLEVPSANNNEIVPIPLDDIFNLSNEDDFETQLSDVKNLLTAERARVRFWVRLVEECWNHGRWRSALECAEAGLSALAAPGFQPDGSSAQLSQLPLFLLKANYHLALARRAPKGKLDNPLTGPIGVTKDKEHPEYPRNGGAGGANGMGQPWDKEEYHFRAGKDIENAEKLERDNPVVRDVKAAWLMASGKFEQASRLFEQILDREPTNLMALMGRARIQFSQRNFRAAMKTYQQVLRLKPDFLPDPRIGIGLCFWMQGDREKAKKAWERSMLVNPSSSSPSAPLLLGLLHLNASKDPLHAGGEESRAVAYEQGIKLVQMAFKKDNTSAGAAAMAPLAAHMTAVGGGSTGALKLAERLIAFADSRLLVAEGHLARARAIDSDAALGEYNGGEVLSSYQEAAKASPDDAMAQLGAGGCFVRTEQFPHAINAYETLLRKSPKCVEALAALASIHTHLAFTFHSVSDSNTARKAAKEQYGAVLRVFATGTNAAAGGGGDKAIAKSERIRVLAADRDLYVEVARLWSDEGTVERSLQAWEKAAQIEEDKAAELEPLKKEEEQEEEGDDDDDDLFGDGEAKEASSNKPPKKDPVDPRIRNNLGVQHFNRRALNIQGEHLHLAAEQFERALIGVSQRAGEEGATQDEVETDAQLTVVSYNLAAAYEAIGEFEKARAGYEQVLKGHPEYVEAKARLALLGIKSGQRSEWDVAHNLLKEALTSAPSSAELRALYTYFLVETGQPKLARDFARSTIKEVSRHDLYALCASGALSYHEARENKSQGKDAARDRSAKFTRAAEFFDKALQLHPQCAFAAQGLAIALAEGALGNGPNEAAASNGNAPPGQAGQTQQQPLTEHQARLKNARDALAILTKVKESVNEASVYVNIGHCHFARDEYEKAIENYDMASRRYLNDKSSTVLWYLARGWYHKSLRQQNYSDLQHAIEVGEKATALNRRDLANVFNMAILKQKGFEILFGLPAEKRTSVELRSSFEHLQASQALFDQLVADKSPQPPYPADIVKARASYGGSLQRRYEETLARQFEYEQTEQGKLDQARRAREAEQAKREEAERERLAQIQKQAAALAEQRRKMREEAEQWAALSNAWADEDDEEGRKKRGGGGGGGAGKKRKTKMKEGDEETDSGGEEKPAKKKKAAKKEKKEKAPKKGKAKAADDEGRQMDVDEKYDEDDEDAPIRPKRKSRLNKNVKSAEFIESSDEESD
ncbi:hypothetical protein JCM11641_000144 [Rhodosporidiobolus odoratus]